MASDETRIDFDQIHRRLSDPEHADEERTDEERRRLLERRADRYRHRKRRQIVDTVDLVIFERLEHRYAVPLEDLEEIRKESDFRPVPGVSAVIAGVVNVRGQIVAIHDLAAFRGEPAPPHDDGWVLVGHGPDVLVGLVADHVEGVRSPPTEEIRSVPLSLDSRHGEFAGVVDDTTLVLDFEGLTDNPQFFLA